MDDFDWQALTSWPERTSVTVDALLAGVDRVLAPAGLNSVHGSTTYWVYGADELDPDVDVDYRLLVDSDRIPFGREDLHANVELLRAVEAGLRGLDLAVGLDALTDDLRQFLERFPHYADPITEAGFQHSVVDLGWLVTTSAALLSQARLLQWYDRPVSYLADMCDNGVIVLRIRRKEAGRELATAPGEGEDIP